MNRTQHQQTQAQVRRPRRGTLTVETAIVLPLLFLVVFGLFEFARMVLVGDTLISAAQEACRTGITPGSKSADVNAAANSVLSSAFVSGATVTVTPTEVATAKSGDEVTVSVKVAFSEVSWLPLPQFLGGKVLKASCKMLREGK